MMDEREKALEELANTIADILKDAFIKATLAGFIVGVIIGLFALALIAGVLKC